MAKLPVELLFELPLISFSQARFKLKLSPKNLLTRFGSVRDDLDHTPAACVLLLRQS